MEILDLLLFRSSDPQNWIPYPKNVGFQSGIKTSEVDKILLKFEISRAGNLVPGTDLSFLQTTQREFPNGRLRSAGIQ